jgi:hypothetical protein
MALIFAINMSAQWQKLKVINYSKKCCPNATSRRKRLAVLFSDASVQGKFRPRHQADVE